MCCHYMCAHKLEEIGQEHNRYNTFLTYIIEFLANGYMHGVRSLDDILGVSLHKKSSGI